MNNFILCTIFIISLFVTKLAVAQPSPGQDTSWEIKYFLFIDTQNNFRSTAALAKKENSSSQRCVYQKDCLNIDELLLPTAIFKVKKMQTVGIVLIQFDREGRVLNKISHVNGLRGIRESGRFSFIAQNGVPGQHYDAGYWDTRDDPPRHYLPAACSDVDAGRYGRPLVYQMPEGAVGCREWTAQLYRRQQPYIDVTTYNNGRSFIGQLMGWARFEDSPKPVIGKQGGTWLCLHDCPAGERPGIIPNIRNWTRRHGYPIPVEKLEQPEYLNAETED